MRRRLIVSALLVVGGFSAASLPISSDFIMYAPALGRGKVVENRKAIKG